MAKDNTYKGRIEEARKFYKKAEEEFIKAREVLDEASIRQSAEKGWISVGEATNALFIKKGLKLPKGTRKREEMLFDLQDKDKKLSKLNLGEKFSHLLRSLHIDCFYDGDVSVKRVQRDLRKVNEYIKTIEVLGDGKR
jgi:hypothetical protein